MPTNFAKRQNRRIFFNLTLYFEGRYEQFSKRQKRNYEKSSSFKFGAKTASPESQRMFGRKIRPLIKDGGVGRRKATRQEGFQKF